MLEEKSEVCVWRTAAVAVAIFVGVMFFAGMFGGIDVTAVAAK